MQDYWRSEVVPRTRSGPTLVPSKLPRLTREGEGEEKRGRGRFFPRKYQAAAGCGLFLPQSQSSSASLLETTSSSSAAAAAFSAIVTLVQNSAWNQAPRNCPASHAHWKLPDRGRLAPAMQLLGRVVVCGRDLRLTATTRCIPLASERGERPVAM